MPKALCLIGLVMASLVLLIFLIDLIAGLAGVPMAAPVAGASLLVDILFILCAAGVAYASWATFREQR